MSDELDGYWEIAARELEGAQQAWLAGNIGKSRVCARRAAGFGLRACLEQSPDARYGRSLMDHLGALADDPEAPTHIREAAHRLSARPAPESGWRSPLPEPLTPATDAQQLLSWLKP